MYIYIYAESPLDVWDDERHIASEALADLMLEVDGNGDGFIDFKAWSCWFKKTSGNLPLSPDFR